MISLDEIDKTILELESHDTTYATVEKLAWLYIVRDHLTASKMETERTGIFGNTEFCSACSDVPLISLMDILSEHMEVIKALYPKEYTAIIEKISKIKD